ncbi:Neural cell adhesion molecule 1, partial [Penaeus vannamei]
QPHDGDGGVVAEHLGGGRPGSRVEGGLAALDGLHTQGPGGGHRLRRAGPRQKQVRLVVRERDLHLLHQKGPGGAAVDQHGRRGERPGRPCLRHPPAGCPRDAD